MRHELKYLVPESDRDWLHDRLAPFVRADQHASGRGRKAYVVRSIYFDTPRLKDFTEKQDGILRRRKLRLRGYGRGGADASVFLEIKHKHEARVWKDRVPLRAGTAAALIGARRYPDEVRRDDGPALDRFCYWMRREGRRPVMLVTYDREPLVGRFDPSLRITFDRNLRCAPYPEVGPTLEGLYSDDLTPVLRQSFILEVKFDRVYPSWLRSIVAERSYPKRALSKYVMSLLSLAQGSPWRYRGGPAVRALAQAAGAP